MKLIEAIIRPDSVDDVRTVLQEMNLDEIGIEEIMVSSLRTQKGKPMLYRGVEYMANFIVRMKVEIVISDNHVQQAVDMIRKIAEPGSNGDFRIFVLPVVEAI